MTTNSNSLPLEGIRIAEITVVWAGPHVTQVLGEWGADIIRVEPVTRVQPYSRGGERVQTQEAARRAAEGGTMLGAYPDNDPGEDPWNRSAPFNAHARNKRSMACDIMLPEGKEAFLRLIEKVDVLIENNVPVTIERAGITYDVLREVNPRLIMLRMPAYGLTGPYKNYRGFGTHVEGMIGHHWLRGYPDGSPDETGEAFTADALAGVMGAFAVTSALLHRHQTGVGQQIEMPLAEAFLPALGEWILDYTMNGRVAPPQGNLHRTHAPHSVFPTTGEDQWIAIDVGTDTEFRALCEVLGAPELPSDARFATAESRKAHEAELNDALSGYTRPWVNDDLFHRLQAAGVCAGSVHDEKALLASPHLNERGFFETLTMEGVGTHVYPGIMTKWANTPNHIRTPPVKLGEHNEEIYIDLLGYSREEYDGLVEKGLVGTTYPESVVPRHWLQPSR
jgi:crotonobetainyl-CoA:carnitine CoA-transferase CaiB-like acyl-CoA transferase